jgi:hypothetical protein
VRLRTYAALMLPALVAAVSVAAAPSAAAQAPSATEADTFARQLARAPAPKCDTWLVATGSEERPLLVEVS